MRNFSNAFKKTKDGFIGNLTLTSNQTQLIINAKTKIQDYLRKGINEKIKELENIIVEPRFMSQGSAVYKTRNKPCFVPPQHIDHDLGCYLPLSIAKELSDHKIIASKIFFTVIDNLLEELANKERWNGIDKSKKTCSRVIINNEIHIDIPLYAIPDHEFTTIQERLNKSLSSLDSSVRQLRLNDCWKKEDIKKVLLAHRGENWKESDPRKLNEYFKKVFEYKGEQLRRICRYLKAWRDYQWKDEGPSSIYLMILSTESIDTEIERDDIALLNVLQKIYDKLDDETYKVINPTDSKEVINISDTNRQKLKTQSMLFYQDLRSSINDNAISDERAIELIQRNLGSRFPSIIVSPTQPLVKDTVYTSPVTHNEERKPSIRTRAG